MTLAKKSNSHLQKEKAACWVNNFEHAIKSLNHAVSFPMHKYLSPTWLLHIGLLFFCCCCCCCCFFKSALVALFLTLLCGKQMFYFEQGKKGY